MITKQKCSIIIVLVLISTVLTIVNYSFILKTDQQIPNSGGVMPYVDVSTEIPTPLGIYVSGSYGDYGSCSPVCLGFSIVEYHSFQLGGFGHYYNVRIK